jgi:DNA-binding MarR family transcriptional regulator
MPERADTLTRMAKGLRHAQVAEVARECTLLGIRQASRAITQIYDAAFAPIGLKGNQFTLLTGISMMGEPTITRLGEALVTDRTTLTRNLAPLEREGFVRIQVGKDRRSRIVTVTTRGSKLLAEAYPLWKRAQARVIEAMGKSRWQGLLDHLSEVTALARK